MTMQLKKATRKQVKLKMNISGPSGSGKTYSALRLAYGLIGDWNKIAVIDTENGSASLYSHLGDFNTIDLTPPYTPERYIEAINTCVNAGIEVIIIDSSSHEWSGPGGCLEINDQLAQAKYRGNTWSAWNETTPRHDRFVNTILHTPIHFITCSRSKMETVLVDNGGKKEVKKLGMKDIQRDGWEYELTVSLLLDRDTHKAMASKDRTSLFIDSDPFLITEEVGQRIKDWCESGVSEKQVAIGEMEVVQSIEDLKIIWSKYKSLQTDKDFIAIKDKRKDELTPAPDPSPHPDQPDPIADAIEAKLRAADSLEKLVAEFNALDPDQQKIFKGLCGILKKNFKKSA